MVDKDNNLKLTAAALFEDWSKQPFNPGNQSNEEMHEKLEQAFGWYAHEKQFVYVYDYQLGKIVFISPNVPSILGYPVKRVSPEFLYSKIHPDDLNQVLQITRAAGDLVLRHRQIEALAATVVLDCRMRHADGHYLKMQRQSSILRRDEGGNIRYTLTIYTDISHLKRGNQVFFDMNVPEYKALLLEIMASYHPQLATVEFTEREKQVLKLIALGKNTKQIALELSLSSFTVDTHRKNMKKKLKARNTAEMVSYAFLKRIIG